MWQAGIGLEGIEAGFQCLIEHAVDLAHGVTELLQLFLDSLDVRGTRCEGGPAYRHEQAGAEQRYKTNADHWMRIRSRSGPHATAEPSCPAAPVQRIPR